MTTPEISTLRLITRAEIAQKKKAQEKKVKRFLTKHLMQVILETYCEGANRCMNNGREDFAVHPDPKKWEDKVKQKMRKRSINYGFESFSDLFQNAIEKVKPEIPEWMKQIQGFEDFEMDEDLKLFLKR